MGKASKKESKKKMTKKERQEQAKEDFKESLDKHMPNSREAVEIATFAGLTTLYFYGAQPIYDKFLSVGFDIEAPAEEDIVDSIVTILSSQWQITAVTEVINFIIPGNVTKDTKEALIGAIVDEVPPGMNLDRTLEGVIEERKQEQERLSRWLAMDDPPQTKEALDSVRKRLRDLDGYIRLIMRIKKKVFFVRLMGAMGAAGLSIYFAQDYNISQLIPGE